MEMGGGVSFYFAMDIIAIYEMDFGFTALTCTTSSRFSSQLHSTPAKIRTFAITIAVMLYIYYYVRYDTKELWQTGLNGLTSKADGPVDAYGCRMIHEDAGTNGQTNQLSKVWLERPFGLLSLCGFNDDIDTTAGWRI